MVCCLLAGCGVCDCCRLFGFVWLVFGVYIWLFTVTDVTMVLGLRFACSRSYWLCECGRSVVFTVRLVYFEFLIGMVVCALLVGWFDLRYWFVGCVVFVVCV